MRPASAPNHQRIVLLRAVTKLMFFALVATLALVMVRAFLPEKAPPPEPLRVPVAQLRAGGVQGVEWNRQRLLIVTRIEGHHYRVLADYDPLYGCPMKWVAPGNSEAPVQPWLGGLRAVCTAHWFDADGRSLTEGVADLKQLPYTMADAETLLITVSR